MHSAKPPAILSVGRLYCDLIFTGLPRLPTLGTEVFADGFGVHAGGGAFITAAHLAQLGHSTSLAAMLPPSPFADLVQQDLETAGIDMALCAPLSIDDGPQITVAMAHNDDRAFLTRKAGPAYPPLSIAEIAKRNFRHIHVGEAATLIAQPEIIDIARRLNLTISVDCGWDDSLDASALKALLGQIDVFLPNETEMESLKSFGLTETDAPVTIVKKGPLGATYFSADGSLDAPARETEVMDATGAGDAFNAGFLSSWLSGSGPRQSLESGNKRGALAVRNKGGFTTSTVFSQEISIVGE